MTDTPPPAVTIDPATDIGYVRLLLSDTDPVDPVFNDAAVQAVIDREGNVMLAAAQLLDLIADNEVLTSKVIAMLDLKTDGAKAADALRKHAAALRARHAAKVADDAAAESGFDVVQFWDWGYGSPHPEYSPAWDYGETAQPGFGVNHG